MNNEYVYEFVTDRRFLFMEYIHQNYPVHIFKYTFKPYRDFVFININDVTKYNLEVIVLIKTLSIGKQYLRGGFL